VPLNYHKSLKEKELGYQDLNPDKLNQNHNDLIRTSFRHWLDEDYECHPEVV